MASHADYIHTVRVRFSNHGTDFGSSDIQPNYNIIRQLFLSSIPGCFVNGYKSGVIAIPF